MSRALKRLYRLTNSVFSHRISYATVSLVDQLAASGRQRPLIEAQGTYDLGKAYPQLVSPSYRLNASLSPTPLCRIMSEHGSDKGLRRHNYTQFYDAIFSQRRPAIKRLFELGIGTNNVALKSHMGRLGRPGASLRGWLDYFPNVSVFAADVDRSTLFSEDRITCYFCDQTNAETIQAMWVNTALAEPFDIIIDDGLHEFSANRRFLENSIHKLAPGGMFFIEDVRAFELPLWVDFLPTFAAANSALQWAVVRLNHPFNDVDNNIVCLHQSR